MKGRITLSLLLAAAMLMVAVGCGPKGDGPSEVSSTGSAGSTASLTSQDSTENPSQTTTEDTSSQTDSQVDASQISSEETSSAEGTSVPSDGSSPVSSSSGASSSTSSSGSTSSGSTSSGSTSSEEESSGDTFNAVVTCTGAKATVEGTGLTVSGNTINVTVPGDYRFSGTWNGRIVVNVPETEDVKLALYGFTATCNNNAVIEVLSADDVTIKSQNGYRNAILDTDSSPETASDTRAKAAIYARSSLEFIGAGSLSVRSDYKHGIACTKKLVISNSTITVQAVDVGLKGNNSVYMTGGHVTVNAKGDGVKTEDTVNEDKGFVMLEGGTLIVHAGGDGIDASRSFDLCGATVTVETTGVDSNDAGSSSKGIKAGGDEVGTGAKMILSAGSLSVTSTGHALRSSGSCNIQGTPRITIASDKNGIVTGGDMTIRGGTVTVNRAEEGLESKGNLKVLGGTVTVTATDNGVNVSASNKTLTVSGGTLDVTVTGSDADAIDSNGNLLMQGGLVIARSKGKSAVNVGKTLTVTAGTLVAIGPVLSTPGTTSTASTALMNTRSFQKGSYTLTCGGSTVASFTLDSAYTGGYICSDKMTTGTACELRKDGSSLVNWTQSQTNQTL